MRKLCLFIVICCLISVYEVSADRIPLRGGWSSGVLRSAEQIPFSAEKEGDMLYLYSSEEIEDVSVRIVSAVTGEVFYEGVYTFITSDCEVFSLEGLPEGECIIELTHGYGVLSGRFRIGDC